MRKISYIVLSLLIVFVGLKNVNAKCYKKTVKLTEYNTSYVTGEATNTKVKKKYCGNKTPCYKHVYNNIITYTTSCNKGTTKSGKSVRKTTCKKVDKGKCNSTTNKATASTKTSGGSYTTTTGLKYVACGSGVQLSKCNGEGKGAYDIPYMIPALTAFAVNALKIVTPVILIITAMIQLLKAVAASNEDAIKNAQGKLVKKMIIAVMVFLVIYIVQFAVAKVAEDDERSSVSNCFSCFLNNDCPLTYYRSGANGDNCEPAK